MDKRLHYPVAHYRERISAYAQDTVAYNSVPKCFTYKVNRQGKPVVIEAVKDHFQLYFGGHPAEQREFTTIRIYTIF